MSNKSLKLITEACPEININNGVDPTKPRTIKFSGPFLQAESVNGNGRRYPYELLKKEIERLDEEMIKPSRSIMELEHSASPQSDPMRACARLLSLKEDGDTKVWIGEAVVLASDDRFGIKGTLPGDTLASLTNYGTKWGVSSKALGDVDEDGTVTDLNLIGCDCVLNPSIGLFTTSDGNRFVNGILESKQFLCDHHGEIVERAYSQFESALDKSPNTYISSKKLAHVKSAFDDFLAAITQG